MSSTENMDDESCSSSQYTKFGLDAPNSTGYIKRLGLWSSKKLTILLFIVSMIVLTSGIICLVLARKMTYPTENHGIASRQVSDLTTMKVFSAPISSRLNVSFASGPGHAFVFNGKVNETGSRWNINLKTTEVGDKREVHYHFNPRMDEKIIVRNSYENGKWSAEERNMCFREFPFQRGEKFQVKIIVRKDKFLTYINDEHYFDFSTRLPNLSEIDEIAIYGDVVMDSVVVSRIS